MSDSNMGSSRFTTDTRAVSETLGYILLMSIMLLSIGSVAMAGLPVIEEQQNAEYMSNTVRAFEIFETNIDTIEHDQAPSRQTEIRYQGGTLFQSEDYFMIVNVTDSTGTNSGPYYFDATPVSYEKGETSVHYENGAVIRQDADTSVMRSEPSFKFTDDEIRLSIVTTTVVEEQQVLSGNGKMAIVTRRVGSEITTMQGTNSPDELTVDITVNSDRYDAWESYFKSHGANSVSVDDSRGEVTAEFTTDEIAIRNTIVRVEAKN